MNDMASNKMFNEQSLRVAVAGVWGEHGAHVDVLDMLIRAAGETATLRSQAVKDAKEIDRLNRKLLAARKQNRSTS